MSKESEPDYYARLEISRTDSGVTFHPQDLDQPEPEILQSTTEAAAPPLEGRVQMPTEATGRDSKISPEQKSGSDPTAIQTQLVRVAAVMCESHDHLNRWSEYLEPMSVIDASNKPSTCYMKRMKFRVPPKSQYIENSETLSHRLKAHKRFYAKHRLRFNQEWQE